MQYTIIFTSYPTLSASADWMCRYLIGALNVSIVSDCATN